MSNQYVSLMKKQRATARLFKEKSMESVTQKYLELEHVFSVVDLLFAKPMEILRLIHPLYNS